VAINTAIVFLKKEKRKVDKYENISENIKEETDDSEIKESQIEHFTKQFKIRKNRYYFINSRVFHIEKLEPT
jgi:hypothetical protein